MPLGGVPNTHYGFSVEGDLDVSMPTGTPLPPVMGFAVGADQDSTSGPSRGIVSLYRGENCSFVNSISGPFDKGHFGASISKTRMMHSAMTPDFYVGAPGDSAVGFGSGAVYSVKNSGTILNSYFNN